VLEGHWGFNRFFVIFGPAGFAVSSLVGGAVTARSGKALQKALEVHAADSSEVGLLMRRIQLGVLADLVILTAIVFVMTTKPTL
jgi:hypothetical protein